MLLGEVKERISTERVSEAAVAIRARYFSRCNEVLRGQMQIDKGIGTMRHDEIEGKIIMPESKVAHCGCVGIGRLSFAVADDKRNLLGFLAIQIAEDAEVIEGGASRVGINTCVEDSAGDVGGSGGECERADVVHVLRLCRWSIR